MKALPSEWRRHPKHTDFDYGPAKTYYGQEQDIDGTIEGIDSEAFVVHESRTSTESGQDAIMYSEAVQNAEIPNHSMNTQVGGDHYAKLGIQPLEYAMANNLNYCQSLCLRYMTRYKDKNGEQDLDKAIHCLELLKEYEYGHDE